MSTHSINSACSNDSKQGDKSWIWKDLDNKHSEFIATKRQCIDVVKELKSRQYWTSSYKGSIRLNQSSRFDFNNANTFGNFKYEIVTSYKQSLIPISKATICIACH